MIVLLRESWFGPDATLYPKDERGTVIPDQFRIHLPSTARELSEVLEVAPIKQAPERPLTALQAADLGRQQADAFDEAAQRAELTRAQNAQRLKDELSKEKKK
ncbi:MAG TPA: hypothetical protein VFE77_03010 [Rhodanobacter sp.]|nr:hypothetical protein [Rhodanobacter sp.]